VDTEPVKLANTVPAVEASFAGAEVQRAASPLWRGAGAALLGSRGNAHWQVKGGSHYRVKDEVPWQVEGSRPIGSRVKRLAQGKLMPASTCIGYYLTQNSQDLRLRRPFPGPRTSSQEGGNLFETDTTQWTLRQAWHL
jgi:hypothetical protein